MISASKPDFLTLDAFRSLLPRDASPFMHSLVSLCFDPEFASTMANAWQFSLRSRDDVVDVNRLTRQLRMRPLSVVLRALEPIIVEVCQPYESFSSAIQAALLLFFRFATITLALSANEDVLRAWLRSSVTLDQVTANGINIRLLMQTNLAMLSRIAAENESARVLLESGQVPHDGVFGEAWRIMLERYGHRAENETDLAAPRYAEQPELWISVVLSAGKTGGATAYYGSKIRGLVTLPFRQFAVRYLRAREYFRHSTMYGFAHVRNELLRLADQAAARGQIEGRNAIWSMTVSEVIALDM